MTDEAERLLTDLRRERDWHAQHGNHADALILNDRIKDLRENRSGPMVERVKRQFESALARRRHLEPRTPAAHSR